MIRLIAISISLISVAFAQDNAADLEFSPYVFKHVDIPFKNNNYAKDWFGSDVALVQHPLLSPAKSIKPGNPVSLPTIAPLVVKWSDLNNVKINEQIGQNFEKPPAKSIKPGNPVSLPTIAPLVVKWSDLNNVKINEQIGQNFEKRVDSHVWWPNK